MFQTILNILLTASGPLVVYLVKKLVEGWIEDNKIKLENAAALGRMDDFKRNAIKAMTQVDLEFLKPKRDSGTYQPGIDDLVAQDKALALFKSYYGNTGLVDLSMFFQMSIDQLEAMMKLQVAASLFGIKHPKQKKGSITLSDEPVVKVPLDSGTN